MPKGYWVTIYRKISDPKKLAAYAELAPKAQSASATSAIAALRPRRFRVRLLIPKGRLPGQLKINSYPFFACLPECLT